MPATKIPQPDAGISTLTASLPEIATDILGETSPMMPLAIKIPMGPRITSALAALYTTAFSPVAPRTAPAFSMALVASTFVPTASSSQSAGSLGSSSFASCAPMPPPCPSMIKIRFIPYILCRYMPCRHSGLLMPIILHPRSIASQVVKRKGLLYFIAQHPSFAHCANQQPKALFLCFFHGILRPAISSRCTGGIYIGAVAFHGNCYIPAALHIDRALIFIIRRGLTVFLRAAHSVTDKCGRIR